jgi:ABC-type phosphate transport system substrate-binding protein
MKNKMRKNVVVVAIVSLALMIIGTSMMSAQISIIVAKSSSQKATKEEAKDIFAGAAVTWGNGTKIQVCDQSDSDVGKTFYASFIGKSANQVRLQWTKLVLSGQAMAPKKMADDAAIRKAVADDPNAIGYIQSSAVDGTVKELARIQ